MLPDPVLADVTARVLRATAGARSVVLIDGRSGAGKTTLAQVLAPHLGAAVVHLDDIYPGWDGLSLGSRYVREHVLGQHRWQRYDWAQRRGAEWHEVDPSSPLVIEGSGALSRDNRALATFGIWLACPEETRFRRAMMRDGLRYAPHWHRWGRQEETFFLTERPDLIADLVVDVSAPLRAAHVEGRKPCGT